MMEVIPCILEKDGSEIERKVKLVASNVDWVQIEIADTTLVPIQTFREFDQLAKLVKSYSSNEGHQLSFEAHLMVGSPEKYIKPLADAGFRRLIAQVEADDPRLFLDQAQYESLEVGLAIDGPTELPELEPFLEEIDVALVMGNEAGATGQVLQPENIEKVRAIRQHFPDLPIAVEQGINELTAKVVRDAGAARLVSTSYIFKALDPQKVALAIERLKSA